MYSVHLTILEFQIVTEVVYILLGYTAFKLQTEVIDICCDHLDTSGPSYI